MGRFVAGSFCEELSEITCKYCCPPQPLPGDVVLRDVQTPALSALLEPLELSWFLPSLFIRDMVLLLISNLSPPKLHLCSYSRRKNSTLMVLIN